MKLCHFVQKLFKQLLENAAKNHFISCVHYYLIYYSNTFVEIFKRDTVISGDEA